MTALVVEANAAPEHTCCRELNYHFRLRAPVETGLERRWPATEELYSRMRVLWLAITLLAELPAATRLRIAYLVQAPTCGILLPAPAHSSNRHRCCRFTTVPGLVARESEAQFVDSDVYTLTFLEVGVATTACTGGLRSERAASRCSGSRA